MREKPSSEEACPYCGLDPAKYEAPSNALEPMTVLNGRYLIGTSLGSGGFGITYIAYDLVLEHVLAIKEFFIQGSMYRDSRTTSIVSVVTGNYSQEKVYEVSRERFKQEARLLLNLAHTPGIVKVHNYFEENDTAYMVMEYLDGKTLKDYVRQQGGRLPAKDVLEKMHPVISSLQTLHKLKIFHRDISPDNIMVMKDGSLVLFDFGGVRMPVEEGQHSSIALVKAGYSPLEQYSSGEQGPWTDEYALAATIYYCVTGKTPCPSVKRIDDPDPLEAPKTLIPDLPSGMNTALLKAMSLKATDRYPDLNGFENALYNTAPLPDPAPKGDTGTGGQDPVKKPGKKLLPVCVAGIALIGAGVIFLAGKNFISGKTDPSTEKPDAKVETSSEQVITPEPSAEPKLTVISTSETENVIMTEETAADETTEVDKTTEETTAAQEPVPTTEEVTEEPAEEPREDIPAVLDKTIRIPVKVGDQERELEFINETSLEGTRLVVIKSVDQSETAAYMPEDLQKNDHDAITLSENRYDLILVGEASENAGTESADPPENTEYMQRKGERRILNLPLKDIASVTLKEEDGYIYADYTKTDGSAVSEKPYRHIFYEKEKKMYCRTSSLNIRLLPDTVAGQSFLQYRMNNEVTICGEAKGILNGAEAEWYIVGTGSGYGYIAANEQYLTDKKPETVTPTQAAVPVSDYVYDNYDYVDNTASDYDNYSDNSSSYTDESYDNSSSWTGSDNYSQGGSDSSSHDGGGASSNDGTSESGYFGVSDPDVDEDPSAVDEKWDDSWNNN